MRILVIGAGAVGGYFGGRLLAAGRDVTFLVRPRRAAELAETGMVILSRTGDVALPPPPIVKAEELRQPFDLILLSCKAYQLPAAMDSFAPAVGSQTAILPLLNGMSHLDLLQARFGAGQVLGGLCVISAGLDPQGRILHFNDLHTIAFGERDGSRSARIEVIESTLSGSRFDARLTQSILQEMWEKWVFLAAFAGITCLMRATIGDIVTAGGAHLATTLLDECAAIAARQGFPPGQSSLERSRAMMTAPGSALTASMLKDIERGAPTEADHVLGDMLQQGGGHAGDTPLLRIAYTHLKAYEAHRSRGT